MKEAKINGKITLIPEKVSEIQERHLMMSDPEEVRGVLEMTSRNRTLNRFGRNGYSYDKSKNMRTIGHIPSSIYYNPFFRNIFTAFDTPKDREKKIRAFFRMFPKLMNVDRM